MLPDARPSPGFGSSAEAFKPNQLMGGSGLIGFLQIGCPIIRLRAFHPCGLPAYILVVWAHDKDGQSANTPMCFFLRPEGRFPLLMGAHIFRSSEELLPLYTAHAPFPRSRRFASVVHDVRAFHSSEELIPSHTVAYFFRSSEELLPSYAVYTPSAFPKVRFRCARCAFLLHPREDVSVMHGSSSLLPVAPKNTVSV